ncbi:GID complex subunit containing RING finger motif [Coemansia sp. RSA 2611]|nr:GID complex subunit containing RING finger motif [Coemansia sp. RSA 2610]KAJ2392026.1 GID complex subunit containing RING finger motif [Coemansia sp. RSA 2611]
MDKINVEHMLAIEEPFIKAPLEQLKRIVRQAQKQAEREASQVSAALGSLAKSSGDMDGEEADAALGGLISRLGTLKRKLAEAKHEEAQLIRRSKQRAADLGELSGFESAGQAEFQRWSRARLDRVLIDYMLRTGNVNTAQKLAAANGLEHFADSSLFALVMATEHELRDQHSCHGALQWCGENRSALRKLDSALEFELRLQEFVELARAGQTAAAIAYAKRHLTAWAPAQMPRIQRAMALLAFAPATTCAPYRAMFDEARWVQLAQAFRAVVFRLYSLPPQPLLHLLLQTGLSALKTPACVAADAAERNRNCPVCQTDTLGRLAQGLPLSHHVNSSLVCRISGDKMDENNPPMRLPNGYVYSLGALSDMAAKHGKIRCPRTDQIFSLSDAKKLFIS